ncbi:MAG: hypothetical protein R6W91_05700 [Thermoplasmata archaeon]
MAEPGAEAKAHGRGITIFVTAILISVITLAALFLYYDSDPPTVTVNEFYDDMIDKNGDEVINVEDEPLAWQSYDLGDRVLVRDRIEQIWFQPDQNRTFIMLQPYSGKYVENTTINSLGPFPIFVLVQGDVTNVYSEGDIIIVENRMIVYGEGSLFPDLEWTIVN